MHIMLRVLIALFAMSWWVLPAMGLIDLSVTWDRDWPVVLEAGWGVLFTGLGVSVLLAGVFPRLARTALVHFLTATVCLAAGALLGHEPEMWWIFVMLAIQIPLLWLVSREGPQWSREFRARWLVLASIALPFGVSYWISMADRNRQMMFDSDITNNVDHYAVQGALGLLLVALPAVMSVLPQTRRLLGTLTALMAGYLGLISWYWPDQAGGFGATISALVMAWSGAVLAASWMPYRDTT